MFGLYAHYLDNRVDHIVVAKQANCTFISYSHFLHIAMKNCNLVRGNYLNAFVFRQYITPKNVQMIPGKTLGMGYHRPDSHLIYSIPKLSHNLNCRSKSNFHGFKTILKIWKFLGWV